MISLSFLREYGPPSSFQVYLIHLVFFFFEHVFLLLQVFLFLFLYLHLDLCLDVIYNQNMKALGLHNLVLLYVDWKEKKDAQEAADAEPDAVND